MRKLAFLSIIALSAGPWLACSSEEENPGPPEPETPEEEGDISGDGEAE